jgi:photosystem II stability/assembly factor-like uncharacterized protein
MSGKAGKKMTGIGRGLSGAGGWRSLAAVAACLAAGLAGLGAAAPGVATAAGRPRLPVLSGHWAPIGPTNIGGRVTGIAADPLRSGTAYVATATSGVWQTSNAGRTFTPLWPARFPQSIGAITVAPTGTIYVGTGEANPGCGDLSYSGNGVYRSTDGGRTWQNVGLRDSGEIGAIAVDPQNPATIYVAAAGTITSLGGQRGLYRSTDGGTSWQRVLAGVTPATGAIDVAIDPGSPKIVLAAMFDRRETQLNCGNYGGRGSGVYRSADGGTRWSRLGTATGLPAASGGIGRIGVAFAPSQPNRGYAIVVTKRGPFQGFYATTDAGASWRKLPTSPALAQSQATYGWYYGQLWVDPRHPLHVFSAGLGLAQSTNGGRTWQADFSVHVDQHALAWDPLRPGRVYLGNDGGFYTSVKNAAAGTWTKGSYEPWTQVYTVAVSNQDPSRVAGGTQDNGSIRSWGGPRFNPYFGGDGQVNLINPDNQKIVYACSEQGSCARSSNGGNALEPMTATSKRFNWTAPLVFDPADPKIMYLAGDQVNRSVNGGATWSVISPDLTGGPGPSNAIGVIAGTITALGVTRANQQVIYAGTDDGRLWVTRNLGHTWRRLLRGLPWVQSIAVDPENANVAYVSLSTFRAGSDLPDVRMTTDGGRRWTDITGNLPMSTVTSLTPGPSGRVLYATLNDGTVARLDTSGPPVGRPQPGQAWAKVGTGLPDSPVMGLTDDVSARALYVATFGHGFYVLRLPGSTVPVAKAGPAPPGAQGNGLARNFGAIP